MRSAMPMGTRKSAIVRPRSAAVVRSRREGDGHRDWCEPGTAPAPRVQHRVTVLDSPHMAAGSPGGPDSRREHSHDDARQAPADDRPGHPRAASRPPAGINAPTTRPSAMPSRAPARPRTPASTTTERQTWPRVIPAARRMPISRTRSMTFMVSVLTMPSAAMRTATAASASNRPKIRPSASLMAPSIRSSGTTSRPVGGRGAGACAEQRGAPGRSEGEDIPPRRRPGCRASPSRRYRLAAAPGIDARRRRSAGRAHRRPSALEGSGRPSASREASLLDDH